MKKELAIFLNLIVTANAGTILDGAACTKTEDCKGGQRCQSWWTIQEDYT